jgi:pentatricopeptide repeat protein
MIAGYAQNGYVDEALKLFLKMPNQSLVSWNAMIAGYAQNGFVDEALKLFQKIPWQTVESWNAMIAGYAQNGHGQEALKLFEQMQVAGMKLNAKTFASALPACASLAALEKGKEIHEEITKSGLETDIFVASALVHMYAKCGSIDHARNVFDKMRKRDVVSWTAMIEGYAIHGCGKEALKLFEQMQHCGVKPNHITLVGVLSACCHAGLVEEGRQYFDCMSQHYHITPRMEHYSCMVDLLGRAGHLDEAEDFVNKMPIKPDATVWRCLLGACRAHNNIELGKRVAEYLFELDPDNASPYLQLANIYATAGRWDGLQKVRKMMNERQVKKEPGCSWIEVNKQVYAFLVGDSSMPQTEKTQEKVGQIV